MTTAQELESKYILHTYSRFPLTLSRGEGSWVWDEDGKRYLDLMQGIAVNALGHSHPAVVAAITEQASRIIHTSNLFYMEGQGRLAKILCEQSGLARVFFGNSGTEANEGAIKFARRYWQAEGARDRIEVITFAQSFHGRTYGSMSATGQDRVQQDFGPLLPGFLRVTFNDVDALAKAVSEKTAAVMMEPVLAEGGVLEPTPEFLAALKALQEKFGFLIINDEVQTGVMRCGDFFAHKALGLHPDLVTLAKAVGGGLPLGAICVSQRVADHLGPGDHAATFGGNPCSVAAGLAVMEQILAPGFAEGMKAVSDHLRAGLTALCRPEGPKVEVRGRGMLIGVSLTVDPAKIIEPARARGLIVYRANSVLRLLPPLNLSMEEADFALKVLGEVVHELSV